MIDINLDKIACELVEQAISENAEKVKIDPDSECVIYIETKMTSAKHVTWTIQAHEVDDAGNFFGPATKWLVDLPIEKPQDMKATLLEKKG